MAKKEHSKGKHAVAKKDHYKVFIFAFLLLFIICFITFLIYKSFPKFLNLFDNKSDDTAVFSVSTNLDDSKFVTGSNSIIIKNIHIKSSESGASLIEISFENVSNTDFSESTAHFYSLNSTGNVLFGMPLTIPNIPAHSSSIYKILCTNDLSDSVDYDISIQ